MDNKKEQAELKATNIISLFHQKKKKKKFFFFLGQKGRASFRLFLKRQGVTKKGQGVAPCKNGLGRTLGIPHNKDTRSRMKHLQVVSSTGEKSRSKENTICKNWQIYAPNTCNPVFEPGRDSATLSGSLFECRTKINHPRHQVANKYQMSHI